MFKKFIAEFKEFVAQGNVMDLAVGMIMGTTFTGVVKSLVDDVIMPIAGTLIGGVNFADLSIKVTNSFGGADVVIRYGAFLQNIINFLLIALCVFLMIKFLNVFRRKKADEVEETNVVTEVSLLQDNLETLKEIQKLLSDKEKTYK